MRQNSGSALTWIIIAVAILIIIISLWRSRSLTKAPKSTPTAVSNVTASPRAQTPSTTPFALAVGTVSNDSNIFLDKTVAIRGSLTEWVTDRTFVISDVSGGWLSSSTGDLLVISSYAFIVPTEADNNQIRLGDKPKIYVKGQIKIFNLEAYANQLNLKTQDLDELENFDGKAVLIADTIKRE